MTDRIEKQAILQAPRSRVWRAISDQTEFGTWFAVKLPAGTFTAGETVTGNITHPGYEHLQMTVDVVEILPEERLSFQWHPYAIDPGVDYSAEPPTLVTFTLEDAEEGTRVSIVESGFDRIPPERREEAFKMNESGWSAQLKNIERHVSK